MNTIQDSLIRGRNLFLSVNLATDQGTYSTPARSQVVRAITLVICLCCGGIAIGYGASRNPAVTGLLVAVFLAGTILALAGLSRFTAMLIAIIPWLVMLNVLIPKLTLTFLAATSALLMLSLARHYSFDSILWIGPPLFLVIILAGAIESAVGEQLIEASKYTIFPAMAFVVTSRTSRQWLIDKRSLFICSGVAAMAAQGAIILLHLGSVGTKYGVGEELGFATQNPHELGLVGSMVAIACLISVRDIRLRLAGAVIAVSPALATGVRSALVGTVLALIVLMIRARFRPSTLVVVGALCAVVIFSGVGTIIAARYEQTQSKGELSNTSKAGSRRGAIWTSAISYWEHSGPEHIIFGNGFKSVQRIEEQSISARKVAQSDLVATLVELGIVGLCAWLLIWFAILRSGIAWIVLLPLLAYALVNGSLEYVGAIVFGICLAGACAAPSSFSTPPSNNSGRDTKRSDQRVPSPYKTYASPLNI